MVKKPNYSELEKTINKLEEELSRCKHDMDILKERQKKNALKLKILSMAPTIIAFHDKDLNIVWANKAYEAATGLSIQEMAGRKCYSVWGLAKSCRNCPVVTAVRTGKSAEAELTPQNQDHWPESQGSWLSKAEPVFDGEGNHIGAIEVAIDITERKKTDEALRDSEEKLRLFIEHAPAALAMFDREMRYIAVSHRWIADYRLGGRDILGQSHYDVFPEIPDRLKTIHRRGLAGEIIQGKDEEFVRLDGTIQWLQWEVRPWRKADGTVGGIVIFSSDITERKKTEEALRDSETLLRKLIRTIPDLVWLKDQQGIYLACNPRFESFFGAKEEDIIGKTDYDFVDKELADFFIKHDKAAMAKGKPVRNEEEIVFADDGHREIIDTIKTPMFKSDGQLAGVLGIGRDITERKQAEAALQESENKFKTLFGLSPQSVALTELETGVIVDANKKFFDLFGYTDKEMIGRTSIELSLYSKQDRKRFVDELKKSGEASGLEVILKTKDGLMLNVLLFASVIQIEGASYILTYLHNITEEKRLEAHLRQQQKLESIGSLASGVAHEINNPINGIMNYAQLIKDKIDAENPLSEYADEIIHETERVATIVRNLLTFSREEKEAHSPAELIDIIGATMSLIQTVFRRDQITLEVDVPEDLPKIKCRSQQIQQVIMNLMTNARDALNEKYPAYDENKLMKISSNLFEKDGRRWIRTTVEDRGIGIDPDVQKRMFDPFYSTKERAVGTGLGLSISYGIVREHRGELTVESEPGQYTRFHVDLPVDNGWRLDG